jgi:cyanophycinase-like exopeptidase
VLCLQGGAEFSPECRAMDADLLLNAGGGPVVVAALAGATGREYRTAGENGVRHFTALGAADVSVAPDVREDPEGALAALRRARLLVLPGGSPSRLLDLLNGTPVGRLVQQLVADGGIVLASSAGAMVLCDWTVLPDRPGPGGPAVVRGLGLAGGLLVVPHWSGVSRRGEWLRAIEQAVPDEIEVIGIPEWSGLLVEPDALTAVGAQDLHLVRAGRALPVGQALSRAS